MPDADSEARRRVFTTAEGLAALSRRLLGESGAREYIRRLVLIVATGNGDAHLKNWSVLYPDRRRATWAPVYDQVCLLPWDNTLALPWFGVMNYAAINQALLVRVGAEGQLDAATTLAELDLALERLSKAWPMVRDRFPAHVRGLLRAHWRKTPLLSSHQLA
jgi:serine/threonine-protein kinase HipA